ncbi:MAG: hypothetical protein JXR83_11575 [Deltaproteobacteria bacterium]|nr:hypothetical protein [Deltaproteobacteria bacterium]
MPRVTDANIRLLVQQLAQDGVIDRKDVDQLVDAALNDKILSDTERKDLRQVLTSLGDKFDCAETRQRLKSFLAITNAGLRNLSHQLERDDGVIDIEDAGKLVDLANKDGSISGRERYSLRAIMVSSKLTDDARARLAAAVDGVAPTPPTPPPTPPVDTPIDLNLPPVAGQKYTLSPAGHLVTGSGSPARYDEQGAISIYRAADALARADGVPLASVPTAVKEKMLEHLQRAFDAGRETDPLPRVSKQRMRSGAATTLLCLIEGCQAAEAPVRQRALDLYFKQALAEPLSGLRASMCFNLERLEGALDAADRTRLQQLRDAVIPKQPPYDKWFADGKREIKVKHYAHAECWQYGANPIDRYTGRGYQLVEKHEDEKPPRWVLSKTNSAAAGGPISMQVEVYQTHDGIFSAMDDPDVNMILYTGHSNLGGNVSEELRLGSEQKGEKLVLLAMCRGKQNMYEVANKYPNCGFVTTDNPSSFSSVMPVAIGLTEGVLNQRDYVGIREATQDIWDSGGKNNYFYPHEARRYALYDQDRDGVIDGRNSTVDRLFHVDLKLPPGTKVDLVARANDYQVEDLDGTKVQHAVQFLNTLMTYHVDHGNHTSAFKHGDMDCFLSKGWFDGPTDKLVKLDQVTVNGKPMLEVRVNKALADQSWFSLGTLLNFEVCRELLRQRAGGTLSAEDEARAALFAGEYLCYMYCSFNEAAAAVRGIGRYCQHLHDLDFRSLYQAIESDGHGYVTDKQMQALLQTNG